MMYNKKLFLTTLGVISALMVAASIPDAAAHASWTISPHDTVNNYLNKKIRVVIGETDEPAYSDELANFELTISDANTLLKVPNAFRDFTNANAQALWVDAYFYPTGTTPGLTGADCGTTKVKTSPTDTAYVCGPAAGYTAEKTGQNVRNIFGKPGVYQADAQWYTEAGRTLYHMYGKINYYNDVMIPIDIWTDGTAANSKATNGQVTFTSGGSFGLTDRTTQFWPQNSEQPENMRQAMADNFNLLEEIKNLINSLLP
jgi:hypothetical protein